ncbi:MAG TPA: hypothetical protein QF753_03035 [Victivallales bacterium]|nr:hypothetical protein [Victivallales bacterium]
MHMNINLFFLILTIIVALWLFYKTKSDYRKLTSGDKDILINPRSFWWKGILFVVVSFFLLKPGENYYISLILFILFIILGLWNIFYGLMYLKWKKVYCQK